MQLNSITAFGIAGLNPDQGKASVRVPGPMYIKLYAKSKLIHFRIYSKDIEMQFKLDNCDCMAAKRGKVIRTEGVRFNTFSSPRRIMPFSNAPLAS